MSLVVACLWVIGRRSVPTEGPADAAIPIGCAEGILRA